MQLIKSPLELSSFSIINSKLSFSHPEDVEEVDVDQLISCYKIELDYMIRKIENHLFTVFTKVAINEGIEKTPGHSIFAESVSFFRLTGETLSQDDVANLIGNSAVSIAFGNLRNYIATMTSFSPTGSYLFPVFDLQALIKAKSEKARAKKTHTKTVQKTIGNKTVPAKKVPTKTVQSKKQK